MSYWICANCDIKVDSRATHGCKIEPPPLVYDHDVFKAHTKALEIQRDKAIKERDVAIEDYRVMCQVADLWRTEALVSEKQRDEARALARKYKALYEEKITLKIYKPRFKWFYRHYFK